MDKEQENYSFVHDTINLDEIRALLQGYDLSEKTAPTAPHAASETAANEKTTLKQETVSRRKTASKKEKAKDLQNEAKVPGEEIYGILHDLVYILAAVTILFVFVVRLVGVDGNSMLPTLHNMDFLVLESNFLYGADDIENGDIVVLNVPYYEDQLIVKRVIATEGQTVDIDFDAHEVYVDGVLLQEDYINAPTAFNWSGEYALQYPATVPEGCIFVLGDNRNDSTDSRFAPVGMIDTRCVLGEVRAIVLPGQTVDAYGNAVESRDWSRIGLVS